MPEHREQGLENIVELLVLPAVALLESMEFGGNEKAEKVRDGFAGLTEIFAFIALPFLIPFIDIGESRKKE